MYKKKAYFLINSLEAGGAERVIINLAKELSIDYDVDIITLKGTTFYEIPPNIRHICLSKTNSNIIMLFLFPYYIFYLRRILGKEKYVNGISSLEIANFIHILSKKEANIGFETNIDFFTGFIGNIYKGLIKLLYPLAGKIKVNSEENRLSLSKFLNVKISKIYCIYNPIDLGLLQSHTIDSCIRENILNIQKENQKIFITVGRLIWQKQHIQILKGFLKVKTHGYNFLYLIIGDGPEREGLEKFVNENGLDENIKFLGTQKDIYSYLKLSNYFIYASLIEGFPNVLVEAIAVGIPILTADFKTGAREAIFGEFIENLKSHYPIQGPNGYLLSEKFFVEELYNLIQNDFGEKILNKQVGLERFDVRNSIKFFKKYFL